MPSSVHRSKLRDVDLPRVDLVTYLFANPHGVDANTTIYLDPESKLKRTLNDVIARTGRCQGGLQELGLQTHDVVALWSPNHIDYAIVCLAVIGAGAIVSPMSAFLTEAELHAQVQLSGAKYLVVHSSLAQKAQRATRSIKKLLLIQLDGVHNERRKVTAQTLMVMSNPSVPVSIPPSELETRPAVLCFSSGTSGPPKGVITTHRNITSNMEQWTAHGLHQLGVGGHWIAFLPFSHTYAFNLFLCQSIRRGMTTVVMPQFEWNRFLSYVQTYRPSDLFLVPPIVLRLAKSADVSSFDLSSVTRIMSAAAPLSLELANAVETRFRSTYKSTLTCYQAWGLTETNPLATLAPCDGSVKKRGVGFIIPNMEFRFVDPDSLEDCCPGEQGITGPGEIWCRGPNVSPGYFRNEKATHAAFSIDDEGRRWFRTGDIATIDQTGWVEIRDRIKEMIKYKGLQVIPSELEGKTQEHPDVVDCCVVPWWDSTQATELPTAFVVLHPEVDVSRRASVTKDISRWLDERVSSHKRMRGGIFAVENISKSQSGKILRRIMRQRLQDRRPSKL